MYRVLHRSSELCQQLLAVGDGKNNNKRNGNIIKIKIKDFHKNSDCEKRSCLLSKMSSKSWHKACFKMVLAIIFTNFSLLEYPF